MFNHELFSKKYHHSQQLSLSLITATILTITFPANACGPDFINRLLVDRNNTLLYMPEGNFAFEANKLAEIDKTLPIWKEAEATTQEKITEEMSSEDLRTSKIVEQMRASNSIEQAEALSKGLSAEERLYTLGAVAFKLMDKKAIDYFTQVTALPEDEQENYGLEAQYSLGRALMEDYSDEKQDRTLRTMDSHPDKTQLTLALAAFQKVIDRVKNGERDVGFLSLTRLGQQAKIHIWLGNLPVAAHLYAQQSAQGDESGNISLRLFTDMLVKPQNEKRLETAIKDPLIQQLVTIQLFSNKWTALNYEQESEKPKIAAKLFTLVTNASAESRFQGRDRLAALAYRTGHYDLAATLLKTSGDSALSWWLRAKMALRGGDIKAATAAYAKAAAGFPSAEIWATDPREPNILYGSDIQPTCRIAGEQGILALNRGDYLQAMTLFYRGKDIYVPDIMDIAERVLTINELKDFVDKNVPAVDVTPSKFKQELYEYGNINGGQALAPENALRNLLARRLMRAGRYNEALTYFLPGKQRQWAKEFADYLNIAHDLTADKLTRAQAYYQAAELQRFEGVQLFAYEMTPDYAIYGSNYSYVGDSYNRKDWQGGNWLREEQTSNNVAAAPVPFKNWIASKEAARAKAALPKTNNTFLHYRWKAVDLASQSAELLSPNSQAYTMVLCNAESWIRYKDKGWLKLYHRYTKKGTFYSKMIQNSESSFKCAAPDFGGGLNVK
ncbi:hypothetical protein AL518_07775 [Hafnia paralvei]|uniref:hypothetical protein n=1 Tax=Hafnia paralvei TaxID=546367 RepID=UPI00076B3FF9|nr:hypothetical protein [Hafnia paralvei]AMH17920.1 hypothetical protein AL518_07775 [Hafnia paralvei]